MCQTSVKQQPLLQFKQSMNERSIAYAALHPKLYIYNNPAVYFWFKMF
jgi:hypothetical protein